MTIHPTAYPHTHETDIEDGVVFRHRTSLYLWGLIAGTGVVLNLAIYTWLRLDVAFIDGPTRRESSALGAYLIAHGLLYAAAGVALYRRSRIHPQRPVTPWLVMVSVVVVHLLAGLPALWAGAGASGGALIGSLLFLNPFTYVIALPVIFYARVATRPHHARTPTPAPPGPGPRRN